MASADLNFETSRPAVAFRKIEVHPSECDRLVSYLVDANSSERAVYDYVVSRIHLGPVR